MLNCKYIIIGGDIPPLTNPWAAGNAWFAKNISTAASPAEALDALGSLNPRTDAVITGSADSSSAGTESTIALTSYSPKRLAYTAESAEGGLAVFSEIYYPAGWKAYIDGAETEILCADYLLRALNVPAGKHEIIFEFEPESFVEGDRISMATSGILILVLAGALVWVYAGKRNCKARS